jgi:hypothetical protein
MMVGTNQNLNLMKTRNLKIYILLLGMVIGLFACQPNEFSLGTILSKEDLKYSITQNPNDPNMVILESLTPGMTPLWITPVGRSTKLIDTLRFPFAGDYQFIYGVQSAGGFVQADAYNLTITGNNFDYVTDPLWTMLTGGVGNSKTWIPDTGEYGKKQGFYSCFGPDATWDDMVNDNGNWKADGYVWWEPSNGDAGITAEDLAQFMTFSLADGGADYTLGTYTADDLNLANYQSIDIAEGSFNFDAGSKSIDVSGGEDVQFAHGQWAHLKSLSWSKDFKILMLTDDILMIANLRDKGLSGEEPCWYVWNFVSKEYAENYVPEDLPDPEPALPDGWQDDISQVVSTSITWKFSENNPIDWANLDGSLMNGWQVPEDYPDWLGTPDPSVYGDFSMTMNSADGSVVFVTPDGTTTEGTYSIDEKGIYSFDITVPTFTLVGWASFSADANNQLRITKIEKDVSGTVTGMWLGKIDPEKPEYMAYHVVPQFGGGASGGPQGTEVAFDNSKLVIGDLEGKGNIRLEIFNAFGSTNNDPGLDVATVKADNRIEINFTISGATFVDSAAGSYPAGIGFADGDWSAQYWGGGDGDVAVTGNGNYTVYCDPGAFDGATVFVIDIQGMATDLTDVAAVSATIDKIVLY